jgi:hypothetical protein
MRVTGIDLESVDTDTPGGSGDSQTLPAGKYTASISRADYGETKAGNGMMIKLELLLVGGEHGGRVVFENLNIQNNNPIAEKIASERLAEICDAIGLPRKEFDDTDQLEGKLVTAHVKRSPVKPSRAEYGDDRGMENSVSRFSKVREKAATSSVDVSKKETAKTLRKADSTPF